MQTLTQQYTLAAKVDNDEWRFHSYESLSDSISLSTENIILELSDIYEDITFAVS